VIDYSGSVIFVHWQCQLLHRVAFAHAVFLFAGFCFSRKVIFKLGFCFSGLLLLTRKQRVVVNGHYTEWSCFIGCSSRETSYVCSMHQ